MLEGGRREGNWYKKGVREREGGGRERERERLGVGGG